MDFLKYFFNLFLSFLFSSSSFFFFLSFFFFVFLFFSFFFLRILHSLYATHLTVPSDFELCRVPCTQQPIDTLFVTHVSSINSHFRAISTEARRKNQDPECFGSRYYRELDLGVFNSVANTFPTLILINYNPRYSLHISFLRKINQDICFVGSRYSGEVDLDMFNSVVNIFATSRCI